MLSEPEFALYGYFRSSAAFRVRIALNLKNLQADPRFVHLTKDGGQQHGNDYKRVNPQELIPTLLHDGHTIGQSLAIIEYLDEVVPRPPLLPGTARPHRTEPRRGCARTRSHPPALPDREMRETMLGPDGESCG